MNISKYIFKRSVCAMLLSIIICLMSGNISAIADTSDAVGYWVSESTFTALEFSGSVSKKLYKLQIDSVENNRVSGVFYRNSTHFRDHGCKHTFVNAPLNNNSFTLKVTDVWTVPLSDDNSSSLTDDERTFVITLQGDTVNVRNSEGTYSENTLVKCNKQKFNSTSIDQENADTVDYSDSYSQSSGGSNNITVLLNGQTVKSDNTPVIIDGTTFVPVRPISEAMGCNVYWQASTQTINISSDKIIIAMQIGNSKITRQSISDNNNTDILECDMPPRIINSSTYIPLRDMAEAFGATVSWDSETKTVNIYYVD